MDREEKMEIFNQYKDLAYSISNNYGYKKAELKNDIEQTALLELWECIDRYDNDKGAFTTYATMCITSKIKEFLTGQGNGIVKKTQAAAYRTMTHIYKNKDKDSETIYEELKEEDWFKIDRATYYVIYNNTMNSIESIEGLEGQDEDGMGREIKSNEDLEREIEDRLYIAYTVEKMYQKITKITSERNAKIYLSYIQRRINNEPCSFREIADTFDLTRQRIEQIVNGINKKINGQLENISVKMLDKLDKLETWLKN